MWNKDPPMRKEEWLRRKWREDKDKSYLEICAFKYRQNKSPPKRGERLNGIPLRKLKKSFFNFLFVLFPFSSKRDI